MCIYTFGVLTMTTLADLGATIRSIRLQLGLNLSELATRSQVHRNRIAALERGVGNVELNTLLAICDQLGLDVVLRPAQIAALTPPWQVAEEMTHMQARLAAQLDAAGLNPASAASSGSGAKGRPQDDHQTTPGTGEDPS